MGNDNSKSTIENQQLIMQLQQQLMNQQKTQNQQQNYNQQQQQNTNPITNPNSNSNAASANKLLAILGNKDLMAKIDKNPSQKRKLLEKLLNEHRHMMTTNQVTRITNMLNNVSPVTVSDSLLAVKFNINDYGKNINAYNEKVIQIYGINDSLLYETNQGTVQQRSFLTPPEEQTRNKKNYNSKIAYYNEKIQQINNIINN